MTTVLSTLDELDEAVATGTRGVEIAHWVGDIRLAILTKSCLEQARYYRGEYEQVVELSLENLASLRPEWAQEFFGLASPPSIFGRAWLVMSLAELGRFAEAARHETEALRIAEPMQHAHTIGWACLPASIPYLLKGDWAKARALIDRWITLPRSLDVAILLPWAAASSAWALAQMGEVDGALSTAHEHVPPQERCIPI